MDEGTKSQEPGPPEAARRAGTSSPVRDVDLTSYRRPEAPPPPDPDAPLPTVEGMTQRITRRLPDRLALRVPILIALLVLLASWMQKHLQWSVPDILKVGSAALVGCPLLLSIGERLYRRHRVAIEEGVVAVAVQYLGVLLQTWALALLFVLALVPNLLFSSVTVVAAGVPGRRDVELRAVDEDRLVSSVPTLDGEKTAHTFQLSTTPFGRSFVLKVTGYRPKTFRLFPGLGREFQLSALDPAPAIVARIPPESYLTANDEGEVRVFRREDSGALTLLGAVATRRFYGSYVFGEYQGQVSDLESGWSADLQANQDLTTSAIEVDREKWPTVQWIWRRAIRTDFLAEPEPGDLLEVFHLASAGTLSGRAAFVVTEQPVQDHMLLQLSLDDVQLLERDHPDVFRAVTGPLPSGPDEAGAR